MQSINRSQIKTLVRTCHKRGTPRRSAFAVVSKPHTRELDLEYLNEDARSLFIGSVQVGIDETLNRVQSAHIQDVAALGLLLNQWARGDSSLLDAIEAVFPAKGTS